MQLSQPALTRCHRLFKFTQLAISNAGGPLELPLALRFLQLIVLGGDLLFDFLDGFKLTLFVFPPCGEATVGLLQFRERFLQVFKLFFASCTGRIMIK